MIKTKKTKLARILKNPYIYHIKNKEKVTGLLCKLCNTVVYSAYRHDYVVCKCKNGFIDGGQEDYIRWGSKNVSDIELVVINLKTNTYVIPLPITYPEVEKKEEEMILVTPLKKEEPVTVPTIEEVVAKDENNYSIYIELKNDIKEKEDSITKLTVELEHQKTINQLLTAELSFLKTLLVMPPTPHVPSQWPTQWPNIQFPYGPTSPANPLTPQCIGPGTCIEKGEVT